MPTLTFSHSGAEFEAAITTINRQKLYGRVTEEVLDENETRCQMMTLSSDGKTLIPSGGTAFGYLSPDGQWRNKGELTPFDLDGEQIVPVSSTLKETTALDNPATLDEFLSHKFRLAYLLDPGEAGLPEGLQAALKEGEIFTFPFSYRGGLQADRAFLLASSDGSTWMLVGSPARIEFIGFEAQVKTTVDTEDAAEGIDDLLDFGIM